MTQLPGANPAREPPMRKAPPLDKGLVIVESQYNGEVMAFGDTSRQWLEYDGEMVEINE